ncbi:MAG: 16S rRNA (cytidine(1402)-2'-O)-methyltransferase [Kordiimonas sp.]|nr:16S rRNA (cytidine(1402)-2'-O)-methyltransferase [Kordiimonas sp.]
MTSLTPQTRVTPGLYVTATPIGNLEDITLRALAVLEQADFILCEDTRVTGKLLGRYGLRTPLKSYHDHNAEKVLPGVIEKLKGGAIVAQVSDAGTPLISDPGYRLVREARAAGVDVWPVPGASAALAALMGAGLPTDSFYFAGFLPPKQGARQNQLEKLSSLKTTTIFYESPRRLPACLADMAAILGAREAAVCRELTKLYEEVRRGPLGELAAHYAEAGPPKGEVVIVVGPSLTVGGDDDAELVSLLRRALKEMSLREAVATVTFMTGRKRKQVYQQALELAEADDEGR